MHRIQSQAQDVRPAGGRVLGPQPPGVRRRIDPSAEEPGRIETMVVAVLLAAMLLLRVAAIFRDPVDSDEPQHIHVAWGWAHGLVQYRDVFDNHTPLFHLLGAPLVAAIGERPAVLVLMRWAMLPITVLALGSTFALGRILFGRRAGLWAAVLGGLFPPFFLLSVEVRPDTLWTALWLLALAVLVGGRLTGTRSLVVGAIFGVALGVSIKTTLLLASLGAAGLGAVLLSAAAGTRPPLRRLGRCGAAALVGLVPVPAALMLLFAAKGALGPFLYGVFGHNTLRGLGLWHKIAGRAILFPLTVGLLIGVAAIILRTAARPGLGVRRVVVFLAAGIYLSGLLILWPMVEQEHKLPFYPLLAVFLAPLVLALPRRPARMPSPLVPALVAVLEIGALLAIAPLGRDHTVHATQLLAEVLRLTRPGDPILDLKGETVFRRRSYYAAFEIITRERFRLGQVADDVPECLIRTRTPVAVAEIDGFPPRARAFLEQNYIPVGRLRVLGRFLTPVAGQASVIPFEVRIPAWYAVLAGRGPAAGRLDGTRYRGPRYLGAGRHQYVAAACDGRLALIWAPAVERGFAPFQPVAPAESGRRRN